jgi:hypothetical protein
MPVSLAFEFLAPFSESVGQKTLKLLITCKKVMSGLRNQKYTISAVVYPPSTHSIFLWTKKKRSNRRVPEFSDVTPAADAMDVDEKPIVPRTRNLNTNFIDDDELQAALARSRQAKLHKPKKLSPEDVARQSTLFLSCCCNCSQMK